MKTKKAVKKASNKDLGPKKAVRPTIGHNSNGQVIPGLVELVKEILASSARQKAESRLQRDLRNKAKTEFGVLANVLGEELKKQKMDNDVRVQYESGQEDIKRALGYQPELDFQGGVPTKTSEKAQPSEAALKARKQANEADEDGFEIEEDEEEIEGSETESEEESDEEEIEIDEMPAIPANLRRPKPVVVEDEDAA